ncbi:SDR family oxidoreductase [Lipingzhangella sp. LS1_29]|uniref:SDR family oxidoreductase n=1 Tax=Lipingzhangella rawalii TaxID=2055835 RepID=A0ABU2HAB1_9ACTN|nr:SDR family oxidoreductase [Lipingzhangella rawalii]MDS1271785.1 SDR family oxidoreductase [Lipingzhangella rawalii]
MSAPQRVHTADGLRLAVYSHGTPTAPTVLCVHGYPDNSAVWDHVLPHLRENYHVVTYDVRGAGRSPAPKDRSGYRLDRLADDLARVAAAVSPHQPVHLLAHDWGAIQAWHAITDDTHAPHFASLTSISGPCLDHAAHWMRSGALRGARQAVRSSYIGFFQTPMLPELSWLSGAGGLVLAGLDRITEPRRHRRRTHRELRDHLNGLNLYRENMGQRMARPGQRHTDHPVQVLAPTREIFMTEGTQASAAHWAPNFRFHRVDGAHWLPRSRPDVVARRVDELIREVTTATPTTASSPARSPRRTAGPFAGQLAVVTGAGSGIGRATAFELAERGARVVAVDRDREAALRTAELATLLGPSAGACQVDVADGQAMEQLANQVRDEYGTPDIVINNAGIGVAGAFLDTTTTDWQRVLDVNLWGVIHGCRAFAPLLVAGGGGRIVNTASAAAFLPSRAYPAYATTKAAVLMLSRCLRAELADHGVRVTAVCPGLINTGIIANTHFTAAHGDRSTAVRERLTRLYQRRGYSPERAARRIVNAIDRGPELLPVTGEAHAGLLLSRLAPGVLRAGARLSPPVS